MEEYKLHRNIICIDLKSFFASVECVLRDLDPFTTPLVVADPDRGGGAICLAVSPYLKTLGVPSRLRVFEIPEGIEGLIIAKPHMQQYLNYSAMVVEVYLEFISEDDLYIYSIDEAFLDVTNYLNYYKMNDYELAKKILDRITEKLKLSAAAGIGPNMLLSKIALDIESKHTEDSIAKWTYDDVETKLWSITPLSKMWGIGHAMQKNLNLLGLQKVGDIANYSLKVLKDKYGILGEELYYHTHGIDMSLISEKINNKPIRKSYGIGQVLFRDYEGYEMLLIVQEMVDEISSILRKANKRSSTITLGIGYCKNYELGFHRQIKLAQATDSNLIIYQACLDIINKFYGGETVRRISVTASSLTSDKSYQYSMFEDADILAKEDKIKRTMDDIKKRYGKNSINRATSELDYSTAKMRNKLIGGHNG